MAEVAITLPDELQQFIERSVSSGSYHNPSEVVANALYAWKAQEDFEQAKIATLRKKIAVGMEQLDRGEFVEFDARGIKAEGRQRLSSNSGE